MVRVEDEFKEFIRRLPAETLHPRRRPPCLFYLLCLQSCLIDTLSCCLLWGLKPRKRIRHPGGIIRERPAPVVVDQFPVVEMALRIVGEYLLVNGSWRLGLEVHQRNTLCGFIEVELRLDYLFSFGRELLPCRAVGVDVELRGQVKINVPHELVVCLVKLLDFGLKVIDDVPVKISGEAEAEDRRQGEAKTL